MATALAGHAQEVRISWSGDNPGVFRVSGLDGGSVGAAALAADDQRWSAVFRVHRDSADDTPLIGDWLLDHGVLEFRPRYRLDPGSSYRAVVRASALAELAGAPRPADERPIEALFHVPDRVAAGTPGLTGVSPSGPAVPENLLRLYLHFATPMSQGDAYSRVRIEDGDGRPVELAFLELPQELWDPQGRRLTLLFDPGRIKRDLRPNLEEGTPLREGGRYTLVVDGGWRDGAGRPLGRDHRHELVVGAADRESPDPASWSVGTPAAGSRQPLRVDFGESLDRPQALRWIRLERASGRAAAGRADVTADGRRWSLTPEQPWRPGRYRLRIDSRLEDVAGNRVAEPFEVRDRSAPVTVPPVVTLEIEIGP